MGQITTGQDRHDVILDAAIHAFAVYGFRRVTMEDIARGAGLSRTALYLHFRSKEDIFRSLSVRHFRASTDDVERALQATGPACDVLQAAFVAKDGKFMDIVLGTPHGHELLDAGIAISADIAGSAEGRMAECFGRWLAAHGAKERLGDPAMAGAMVMAALKGLKTSARTLEDYRDSQTLLARMVALSLGQ